MAVTGFHTSAKAEAVKIYGSYSEILEVKNTWVTCWMHVEPKKTGVFRARVKIESTYPANFISAIKLLRDGRIEKVCSLSGNCFVKQVGERSVNLEGKGVAPFEDNPIDLRLDWAARTLTMEYKGQKPIVFQNLPEDCVPAVEIWSGKVTSLPLSAAQEKEAEEEATTEKAAAEKAAAEKAAVEKAATEKAAVEKAAAEKAAVEKATAEKAAAEKAAAEKAFDSFLIQAGLHGQKAAFLENGFDELQMVLVMSEVDMKEIGLKIGHIRKLQTAQIAAASPGAVGTPWTPALPKAPTETVAPAQSAIARKSNRWGDGMESAAAGSRDFFKPGYAPTTTAEQSIKCFVAFGYDDAKVDALTVSGQQTSSFLKSLGINIAPGHCSVLMAFTEEPGFYNALNYTCRTPGKITDARLENYCDYLYHMDNALSSLESYVSDTFRGTNNLMSPASYQEGKTITWQQLSSSSKKSTQAAQFVGRDGRKLFGSMFLIRSLSGKDIEAISTFPDEAEVLFKFNSHFLVKKKVTDEATKKAMLPDLAAYNMEGLDLWELQQL